jgi:hypothetical protein
MLAGGPRAGAPSSSSGWRRRSAIFLPHNETSRYPGRPIVPLGFSVPTIFFFLFTSALIPLAIGTMIVGAILVLGYERLLTRWARRGFSDLQKLGLIAGAMGFFAAFFDVILELIGRLGTSALGTAFIVYILWIRKKIILQLPRQQPSAQLASGIPEAIEPGVR